MDRKEKTRRAVLNLSFQIPKRKAERCMQNLLGL